MSVPQASSRGARSPRRRHSPQRRRATPFAGFPGSVPLVGFPGSVPTACQSIQDEIDGVQADIDDLQFKLRHARPEEKPAIKAEIREKQKQVTTLQKQLAECIASQRNVPPPTEAFFFGSSELHTTNADAPGPFFDSLAFRLNVGGDPARINIETFPALGAAFDTPRPRYDDDHPHRRRNGNLRRGQNLLANHPALRIDYRNSCRRCH